MSQVSKKVIDKHIAKKIKENFLEIMSSLKNKQEANRFLYDFLTQTEQIMLAKRLAIVLMVLKGYNHRQISESLKVSTATVSSMVMWLRYEGKGYRQVLNKVIKKETLKEFWHKIHDYLDEPIVPFRSSLKAKKFYKKKYQEQPIETTLGLVKDTRFS